MYTYYVYAFYILMEWVKNKMKTDTLVKGVLMLAAVIVLGMMVKRYNERNTYKRLFFTLMPRISTRMRLPVSSQWTLLQTKKVYMMS